MAGVRSVVFRSPVGDGMNGAAPRGASDLAGRAHRDHIAHRPSDRLRRNLQPVCQYRLQENIFRGHQSLAHRASRRLAEISALRVFCRGAAGEQSDPDIRQLRAGQNAPQIHFLQIRQNLFLPVDRKVVRAADIAEPDAAARRPCLNPEMNLRVVAERLKMSHSLHRAADRLPVQDTGRSEPDLHAEPLHRETAQNFLLHLSHDFRRDDPVLRLVDDVKHRFLLLEEAELLIGGQRIGARREQNRTRQDRLKKPRRRLLSGLRAESLPGLCPRQPGERHDVSRLRLRQKLKPCPGIAADLIHLLLPAVRACCDELPCAEPPACQFHPAETRIAVARDFEYPRAKVRWICRRLCQRRQQRQEFPDSLRLQRRAETDRKQLSLPDKSAHVGQCHRPALLKVGIQQRVVEHRQLLLQCLSSGRTVFLSASGALFRPAICCSSGRSILSASACVQLRSVGQPVETQAACPEALPDCLIQPAAVHAGPIHLVHKEKGRHLIMLQQPPQHRELPVNAVERGDHQNRIV